MFLRNKDLIKMLSQYEPDLPVVTLDYGNIYKYHYFLNSAYIMGVDDSDVVFGIDPKGESGFEDEKDFLRIGVDINDN